MTEMTGPPAVSTGKNLTHEKHKNPAPCVLTPGMSASTDWNGVLRGYTFHLTLYNSAYTEVSEAGKSA